MYDAGASVPTAPDGDPLYLLPTRLLATDVSLGALTHFDPLLPVTPEERGTPSEEFEKRAYQHRLQQEETAPTWVSLQTGEPDTSYGGVEAKEAFVAQERRAMEQRCRAYAKQSRELRDALGLQPHRVAGDGACAPCVAPCSRDWQA